MASNEKAIVAVIIVLCAVLLICILVPISFHGVEYYEYGFNRRKTTGSVDTTKVYTAGHYSIGITHEFKVFAADAHFVVLNSVAVFTSDRLEVNLDCTFQYFLREEDLKDLHDTYDVQYEDILRSNAIDELKGSTSGYTTKDFGDKRPEIETSLFKAVQRRLGGICCQSGCQDSNQGCEPGCKPRSECTKEDKGFFADVRYFQLGFVDIPYDVLSRNLQTLTQLEDGIREGYIQEAILERKKTEQITTTIENSAEEISQNASAQVVVISSEAIAEARFIVEDANNRGLVRLYSTLDIDNQDQKASVNYIRALRDHQDVFMSVNYNTLVTGQLGRP